METVHVPRRFDMALDEWLGVIAFGSAVFLLFGIIAPRTSWTRGQGPTQTNIDAAGWNILVSLSGLVALTGLTVAVLVWSRRVAVAAAFVAIVAFVFAAYVTGSYWLAISRGELLEAVARMGSKWIVHPTPAPSFFSYAAIGGAVSTLVLAIRRWRAAGG